MNILHDAYTALLSGLIYKTGNEIHWTDKYGAPITIEPIDIKQNRYIVRIYYKDGQKHWETEYQNGQLHGKNINWYKDGQKCYEEKWENGQLHGRSLSWHENGQKHWEKEYQNGQQHGRSLGWDKNGQKIWEKEWKNGKRIL